MLALFGTDPDRRLVSDRLDTFYPGAPRRVTHQRCTDWPPPLRPWPAIEAAIMTNYSNARSAGYNRLAKQDVFAEKLDAAQAFRCFGPRSQSSSPRGSSTDTIG